jgi:PAS domain S-box-containing protein
MRDITNRKKTENELLKLSRAVNQSSASVVITNREGNIEFVNQTLCDLTGYTKEELIGKNPRIWKSGFHDGEYYKQFWDTLLSGNNCSGEILNKKKNGELYWESAFISPLINENGEITHFVAVKEDITEKKNMIADLIKAKEIAESANSLKDAFIANISHEIRTPLNGVLGMTNLIKEAFEGTIKDEDEALFEGLELSSRRIIRTVDMILNYSRLQVGEFRMNPVKINVSQICADLLKQFNAAAKVKSLELSLQVKCANSTIIADENSITIAVSNLIDNAIKYTNEGSVNVILGNAINDDLILVVNDTGIGISEEYLDHVFEPYRQEQMGYGRAYDGIGLGLAMVKKVFDLNNALMKVESKKGVGTTFSINFGQVELPLEDKLISPKEKIIHPPKEKRKMFVLLVEDDLLNQFTIKKFIEKKHTAIVTDSSEKALEILNREQVDLILMDISIRGTRNGLELTRHLKSSKEFSHIPVIAITAHAFESDRQKALAAGCDSYLAKPFSRELLLSTIEEFDKK